MCLGHEVLTEMTEEEILWKMPRPDVGMTVKVWPYGRDDGKPHYAHVARVSDRSIDVQSPLGQARGGVRYIGDPVLKKTSEENQRNWGAWDYTEETKMVMAGNTVLAEVTEKLKEYETKFAELQGRLQGVLMTVGKLSKKSADPE